MNVHDFRTGIILDVNKFKARLVTGLQHTLYEALVSSADMM